jgi:hypothetical protein
LLYCWAVFLSYVVRPNTKIRFTKPRSTATNNNHQTTRREETAAAMRRQQQQQHRRLLSKTRTGVWVLFGCIIPTTLLRQSTDLLLLLPRESGDAKQSHGDNNKTSNCRITRKSHINRNRTDNDDHNTTTATEDVVSWTSCSLQWEAYSYYNFDWDRSTADHPPMQQEQNLAAAQTATVTAATSRPRLLIAQYDGGPASSAVAPAEGGQRPTNGYMAIMESTSRVNRAYAQVFGHDYVVARGLYLSNNGWQQQQERDPASLLVGDENQDTWWRWWKKAFPTPASRATYNKVPILMYAIQQGCYDRLLLLDSDAMIYDHERDMATAYFPTGGDGNSTGGSNVLLVANRAWNRSIPFSTWNVNIGVTLWNLRHPDILAVAEEWRDRSRFRIRYGIHDDDQAPLHSILRRRTGEAALARSKILSRFFFSGGGGHITNDNTGSSSNNHVQKSQRLVVFQVSSELGYHEGLFVKHFIRSSGWNWHNDDDERARLDAVQGAVDTICARPNVPRPLSAVCNAEGGEGGMILPSRKSALKN